jgi:hypothetical protein
MLVRDTGIESVCADRSQDRLVPVITLLCQHAVDGGATDTEGGRNGTRLAGEVRTRTILHIDFVAFFRGMSSSANEFQAFSTGGVRQSI